MHLGDTRLLIEAGRKRGLLRNQMAYVLATAFHETAHTMKPINEMGGEKYLQSKKYWPYIGRGYVQITWRQNYERASKELGVDFVREPKLLLKVQYAAPTIIAGMVEGWFTGKKPPDYAVEVCRSCRNRGTGNADHPRSRLRWPRLPMLCVRVYRDEEYIKTRPAEIDRFNDELAALVERVHTYGQEPAKEVA